MISDLEKMFDAFASSRSVNINAPQIQKYKQDFIDYFTRFNESEESKEFPNTIFYPCLGDDLPNTPIDKYYLYQDTWASRKIFEQKPSAVVDIGSTVLYASIISQFVPTTFVDIRPPEINLPGLKLVAGSILDLPFEDASQSFVTSLCVVEHIGLGRYGDTIMPNGTRRACAEIDRILKPGGELIVSVPLGTSCIAFNAHRIFSKQQFLSYFPGYQILDEVYLAPHPSGADVVKSLRVGEMCVYVVHLKKIQSKSELEVQYWIASGKPVPPPPAIKQQVVKDYAQRFSLTTLVETGTYLGDMVFSMRDVFRQIFSIELSVPLYLEAKERFSSRSHIHILQGDSAQVLPKTLTYLNEPCLFWLDGHYSAGITAKGDLETPIMQELEAILSHSIKNHVILIDDAREFTGMNDYPTVSQLKEFVAKSRPDYQVDLENDILRIHQPS